MVLVFFFQAEDGIRDLTVTGVQTCALPIFSLTGSGTALGIVTALQFGPALLFSLWGGALADRYRKNRLRSEEHTSELQSQSNLVCRLLLEKKKQTNTD